MEAALAKTLGSDLEGADALIMAAAVAQHVGARHVVITDINQARLDLAEKVNEFQARIKQLTRKMMATVSELSMYQATSLKLQAEKERLEDLYETAKGRSAENLPPLPECEEEWEKMERNRIMNEHERKARLIRDEEERAMVGAVTKSTAEPRLTSYVPDDEIGLPKPYGNKTPFMPSQLGANMRHYRKPVTKPIEI